MKRTALFVLAAAALLSAGAAASAQIVADLGARRVTVDDLRAELLALRTSGDMAALLKTMDDTGRSVVLDQLVLREQYALAARAAGMEQRADVAAEIDRATTRILAAHYLAAERQKADVSEPALRAYYQAHRAEFQSKPRVKARHILADSRAAAEAVFEELRGGADFEALAAARSIDPYTRDKGGLLGWISRGVMVRTFEDALFALEAGETSGVIQSSQGFHVVRVDAVEPPVTRSFASVRELIVERVQQAYLEQLRQQLDAQFPVKLFPEALKALER